MFTLGRFANHDSSNDGARSTEATHSEYFTEEQKAARDKLSAQDRATVKKNRKKANYYK